MAIRRCRVHGKWAWVARVQVDGVRKGRKCASREEARHAEAELLRELREQAEAETAKGAHPATLRRAWELYTEDLVFRGKTEDSVDRAAQTARVFEAILPAVLDQPVTQFADRDVFAFRQARLHGGTKPATINRDLRSLRALLRRIRPEYRFPAGAFSSEDDTRVRWLRPEEEILVLESMVSPFREIARLAALTLMRQGELRLLRREDVHLEQGVILLPRAKAGARPVVLNMAAQEILREQLGSHDNEWAFPNPDGRPYTRVSVSRAFRRASRAVGLRDFRFHDLRHHGATMALNAGFTAPIVMALGGWKSEKMMRRYAAVTDQTLRRAAEAVSGNGPQLARH